MNSRQKGSFTVETTLILPLIITVITALLFLVMHMYNGGVIYSAVSRASKQIFYYADEENSVIEDKCAEVLLNDLEGRLVCMEDFKAEVKVTVTCVEVSVSGKMKIPGLVNMQLTGLEDFWTYDICREEPRLHVAELIRNGQQLENIYEEVKEEMLSDGDQIQEGF